jgi:hypothetical protein
VTHTDYDRDTMDWDQGPTEPIVQWQNRPPQTVPSAGVAVGVVTLAVCALGAFALGLLLSERLNARSPFRWR